MRFIDFVLTDSPGFTGDEGRQCLTLTRARQVEIGIAGPGMFVGCENDSKQKPRAAILRRLGATILITVLVNVLSAILVYAWSFDSWSKIGFENWGRVGYWSCTLLKTQIVKINVAGF